MRPTTLGLPSHDLFVALGVLAAVAVFVLEARRRGIGDPRIPAIVAGALLGGALFMRLGTWAHHVDPRADAPLLAHWVAGNRSILPGLFGAWLGVHIAKRLLGYRERTGDLFAPAVAAGLAVGRLGCLLTELPGTPTAGGWGVVLDAPTAARLGVPGWAGVGLHPSFAYEIAFHALAFATLWGWLRHRRIAPGELLTIYLAAYGLFRFAVESVRGNPPELAGLSQPQLFLAATLPLLLLRLAWLWRRGRLSDSARPAGERPIPVAVTP